MTPFKQVRSPRHWRERLMRKQRELKRVEHLPANVPGNREALSRYIKQIKIDIAALEAQQS